MKINIFAKVIFLLLFSFLLQTAFAQSWAWVGGPDTGWGKGNYGTEGIEAPANWPQERISSQKWIDASGNLWLFGGIGSTGYGAFLNDIWKYDVEAREWAWVGGADTAAPTAHFGTKGIADTSNHPGGLAGGVTWVDAAGNFWVFGGSGILSIDSFGSSGPLNALWKYTPSTKQWVWVNGLDTLSEITIYGTRGAPSDTAMPGSRQGSFTWVDTQGNLWLFGGSGYDSVGNYGHENDLWKYNIASNQWTWVGGTTLTRGEFYGNDGNHNGTLGVPDTANLPDQRQNGASWVDASGNFWLFGGEDLDSYGQQDNENDLWRYNPATREWTWMKGNQYAGYDGRATAKGVAAATNTPGSRSSEAYWIDQAGNLWIYGGSGNTGIDYSGSGLQGTTSDLWAYNINTNEWTWVGGPDTLGQWSVYGTQNVASSSNTPGAGYGMISWVDPSGNFWLFGGLRYSPDGTQWALNDVWEISTAGLLGINEINATENDVRVYPNPATNTLNVYIQPATEKDIYAVYDMLGRQISTGAFAGNTQAINVANYAPGMYLLQLNNAGQETTLRFVIER